MLEIHDNPHKINSFLPISSPANIALSWNQPNLPKLHQLKLVLKVTFLEIFLLKSILNFYFKFGMGVWVTYRACEIWIYLLMICMYPQTCSLWSVVLFRKGRMMWNLEFISFGHFICVKMTYSVIFDQFYFTFSSKIL